MSGGWGHNAWEASVTSRRHRAQGWLAEVGPLVVRLRNRGWGYRRIAEYLMRHHIPTSRGMRTWYEMTVKRIIEQTERVTEVAPDATPPNTAWRQESLLKSREAK